MPPPGRLRISGAGVRMNEAEAKRATRRIVDFPLVAMLIAVALFACASGLAVFVERTLPTMPKNLASVVQVALNVGFLLAAYKVAIRHLGESPRDDLASAGAARDLVLGVLGGAALFAIVVGIAALAGVYRITACCNTSQLIPDLFRTAILAGFAEELLVRGILFRWLEELAGSWTALVLTSALFGLGHILNPNASWFSSLAIGLEAGLLLGGAYMLTRSLWAPMGLHAAWNFTQGFVFDVPVSGVPETGLVTAQLSGPALLSGGQFGLEASLIALVVACAAGLALLLLAVRRRQLIQPWWVQRRDKAQSSA